MVKKRKIVGNRKNKATEWGFTRCVVYDKSRVYILAFLDDLGEDKESVTTVYNWKGDWSHWTVEWACTSICIKEKPNPQAFTMGSGGRIHVASVNGFSEEEVDTSTQGPAYRGMLRDIRAIGESVYVTGMGRQVYQRKSDNNWIRIDNGVVVPKGKVKGTGFNSIDGFDEKNIYAAGWKGETWYYNGKVWTQIDSPTNLILERVLCAPTGDVYVCGQAGIVMRGGKKGWKVIGQDLIEDDIWGITWFEDKIWLATLDGLYRIDSDDDIEEVDMGGEPKLTCGWLDAKDGVLWSVGSEDLACYDGKTWSEIILE